MPKNHKEDNFCNVGNVYADFGCIGLTILGFILLLLFCLSMAGCGHNTGTFMLGTAFTAGLDSQNAIPRVSYIDGFCATDISRENSGWDFEIDSDNGISVGKDGTIRGIKRMRRYIGPQMNGYLTKLSKDDPELARQYAEAIKYYWQYQTLLLKGDSTNTGKADSATVDR